MKTFFPSGELQEAFGYDPATGLITWLVSTSHAVKPGRIAGSLTNDGYVRIRFRGRPALAHRLAWLLHYGEWPKDQIDHINGIKTDNRIANLRDVSQKINNQNIREPNCRNRLGVKGVRQFGKRFAANIRTGGESVYLGMFATPEAAHAAYVAAKRELHEGNTL